MSPNRFPSPWLSLPLYLGLLLYTAVGLAFGVGCWLLARAGYLQFPRE